MSTGRAQLAVDSWDLVVWFILLASTQHMCPSRPGIFKQVHEGFFVGTGVFNGWMFEADDHITVFGETLLKLLTVLRTNGQDFFEDWESFGSQAFVDIYRRSQLNAGTLNVIFHRPVD